jgi:isochorismate pyruvate lyase
MCSETVTEDSLPGSDQVRLAELRREIDRLDEALLDLIAHRRDEVERVQRLKHELGLPIRSPRREREMAARAGEIARRRGLPPEAAVSVLKSAIHCCLQAIDEAEETTRPASAHSLKSKS